MLIELLRRAVGWYLVKQDPIGYARRIGVAIGSDCRLISIRPGSGTFGSEPYLVSIGNHVTVCGGVQFVTHDGGVWVFRESQPHINVFGKITVGNNVFLGYGAILMPGVTIGNDVVIGAGSIVTSDIPDRSVAIGAPARRIKSIDEYFNSSSLRLTNVDFESDDAKKEYLINSFDKPMLGDSSSSQ